MTCNPAPTNTDADYLVMVKPGVDAGLSMDNALRASGYRLGGSKPTDTEAVPEGARFWSYTRGEVNFIVTQSDVFHARFLAATSVAKRLNLLDKADRIALFQAVLYARG